MGPGHKPARRLLLKSAGFLFAGALLGISATMNWHFGTTLGKGEVEQQLFGVASLAVDGLKAILPLFVILLWSASHRLMATVTLVLWLLCFSWSMASAIGFSATSRETASSGREREITLRHSAATREAELRSKLAALPAHRASSVVQSELETVDIPVPVMQRTHNCTDLTREDSRQICQPALRLRRELAVAEQAKGLERELKEVEAALRATAGAMAVADPQVHTLSNLTTLSVEQIKVGLAVLIAVLVELASAFGFTVVALATSPETLRRIEVRAAARADRDRLKAEIGNARLVKLAKSSLTATASHRPAVASPHDVSGQGNGPQPATAQALANEPAAREPPRRSSPAASVKNSAHQVEGVARQPGNGFFGMEDLALPSSKW